MGPGNVEKQRRLLRLSSKDTKKCVGHKSLVSQITCSRLDSKSPQKKSKSTLHQEYEVAAGISGQSRLWFGWGHTQGGVDVQTDSSLLAQPSCSRTD